MGSRIELTVGWLVSLARQLLSPIGAACVVPKCGDGPVLCGHGIQEERNVWSSILHELWSKGVLVWLYQEGKDVLISSSTKHINLCD